MIASKTLDDCKPLHLQIAVGIGLFAGGGAARLAAVLAGESPADAILSLAS